jgi:hypothetical protein
MADIQWDATPMPEVPEWHRTFTESAVSPLPIVVLVSYTIYNLDGDVEEGVWAVEKEADGSIDYGYYREQIMEQRGQRLIDFGSLRGWPSHLQIRMGGEGE